MAAVCVFHLSYGMVTGSEHGMPDLQHFLFKVTLEPDERSDACLMAQLQHSCFFMCKNYSPLR